MSVQELTDVVVTYRWQTLLVIAATTIQISPLKLEPWTWIINAIRWVLKQLGHLLSPLILDDVRKMNKELLGDFSTDIKDEIKDYKKELVDYKRSMTSKVDNLTKRLDALDENLAGARQDSVDRYERSQEEYKKLRDDLEYKIEASEMKNARHLMFRFAEGIKRGVEYDKEHWDNMRDLVLEYVEFSRDYENKFINSKCENVIKTILGEWEKQPWEK